MSPRRAPRKRIVVTGVGILASNGIGKNDFWDACDAGRTGIKDISLFDTSSLTTKTAGEIKDFDAKIYLGEKGLRLLDRSTKLVNVAAKLALEDGAFTVTPENTDRTGVVVGTTLGSVWSISEFDKTALIEGPRYVNPALFPNTVINSPASQISIRFVIKGFNTTIATGFTSTPDALKYACDFIRWDRAEGLKSFVFRPISGLTSSSSFRARIRRRRVRNSRVLLTSGATVSSLARAPRCS
jgi:3-oxoacyl-[acyl-carrier-protein] synthase II